MDGHGFVVCIHCLFFKDFPIKGFSKLLKKNILGIIRALSPKVDCTFSPSPNTQGTGTYKIVRLSGICRMKHYAFVK
jgi:hypothetical protein